MRSNGRGAEIVSSLPGRVRMRLPRHYRREGSISAIEEALKGVEGIANITSNLATGSVLIGFDPEAAGIEDVIEAAKATGYFAWAGREVLTAADEVHWHGVCKIARDALLSFKKFDRAIARRTRGKIDGKMMIILLLLTLGIVRALASEKRVQTPWHALVWYAYSAFMHWHNPTRATRHHAH